MHARTVKVGFRTLDFAEALSGLEEGGRVIVADQDKFRPGEPVRQRMVGLPPPPDQTVTPPLYIALRFLTHRKRALLLSLSGVVFGVAIFICTQAQTQGFSSYFIDSTIGSNGALVVRSRFRPRYEPLMVSAKGFKERVGRRLYFEGITNANEIMRVSRQFSNVVSCSPVLRGTVSARAGFENATVDLFGIDPALHAQTTDILQKLIDGNYDDFRNNTSSIIIGSRLAESCFRLASATPCNCWRPTASTGDSRLRRSLAPALDRLIQPGFISMPGLRRRFCNNLPAPR